MVPYAPVPNISRRGPGTRFSAGQEDSGDDVVNSMMMIKTS